MTRRITSAGGTLLLAVAVACSDGAPTGVGAPPADHTPSLELTANGNAVISNGTLKLAVDRSGFIGIRGQFSASDLPRDSVGLVYLPTGVDGIAYPRNSYGSEGWGISAFYEPTRDRAGETGLNWHTYVDLVSFTATENSAVSVTSISTPTDASKPYVQITHDFHPAPQTDNLYEVAVTFENVSDVPISDLQYVRQVYWRINSTFVSYATMQGTELEPTVIRATDGGASFWPRSSNRGPVVAGAVGNFVDVGPNNHGAHLDLDLAELPPGEKKTIYFYYGAAGSEAAAIEAVNKVGAPVYALGQSQPSGEPETFIFAYKREQGNTAPEAKVNGPFTISLGETVHFSAAGSTDPDGDPITCSWDFGDGQTGSGCEVDHTYTLQRSGFTVTLSVTDDKGATGTAQTTVTMTAANQPPVADANGPYSGDAGATITFSSAGSHDPEGKAITYKWEFGDGATSTDQNPTHVYAAAGTYTAKLTVTDPEGLTGTDNAAVTIGQQNRPPVAQLDGPQAGQVGQSLAFTTGATDPDNDTPLTCEISFGGDFVTLSECGAGASHTFSAAGTYTVTLRARDPHGAVGTAVRTVTITGENPPPPTCANNTAPVLSIVGVYSRQAVEVVTDGIPAGEMLRFTFSDPNCGGWTARVDWGDGTVNEFPIGTDLGPGMYNTFHKYEQSGSYTIRMTIRDNGGLVSAERSTGITVVAQ